MAGKRGLTLTLEQANAHQIRHGFAPVVQGGSGQRTPEQEQTTGILGGRKRAMNKTESEFSRILEVRKQRGEIDTWGFEAITMRLADGCRYTPDFYSVLDVGPAHSAPSYRFTFYEVKGGHIWDDSKVKFKVAREQFPWADWEMWQRKRGEWSRLY